MADYIEKNVAIARLTALEIGNPCATMTDAKRQISDTRPADVAPVVHGRWNVVEGCRLDNAVCSNCGRHFQAYYEAYRFCPNCGAKMDGGDNNEVD